MLHPTVERTVERYLSQIDRLLPGWVVGFHVVGSSALGAYRHGRSDIDFVAFVEGAAGPAELRRLRLQHVRSGLRTAALALGERRSPLTGTCNGVFVRSEDASRPVTGIVPVASHTGHGFAVGRGGSDVSPVGWKVLAERGVAVRGAEAGTLGLDPQPEQLAAWNLGNLGSYWVPWAEGVLAAPAARFRLRPRWSTAWGVLGAPRLHHTIATGEVISKEAAGEHARDVLPARWHPMIDEALAYWRMEGDRVALSPEERGRMTAELVLEVVDRARRLHPAAPPG